MRVSGAAGRALAPQLRAAAPLRAAAVRAATPRAAVISCRIRPGRSALQRKHREGKLLSNRDALDALRLLGVERIECLQVYGKASEYLFYQANKARGDADGDAPEAAAAADGAEDDDDEDEEDESELTVARINAVVDWMRGAGIPAAAIPTVITAYPPVLAFSVEERLAPLSQYLESELGVSGEALAAALARRPSLLGLSVDANLRKMVDYLKSMDNPKDQIAEYVLRTL